MTPEPCGPPVVATEVETLRGFLAFYRDVVRRKTEGLSPAELDRALPPSSMTLGGMLKHLAFVEQHWVGYVLAGHEQAEPWASAPWDDDVDWDWHSATTDPPARIRALYDETITVCDAILDETCAGPRGLDALAVRSGRRERVSLRWILVHLVEEYARHAGHADLLRESIDGATGD